MKAPENVYSQHHLFLSTQEREKGIGQRGKVVWLYGLSGAGKTTIGAGLERSLFEKGRQVVVLDGDNLRTGLNADLGFSDDDRRENVRRVAEVARVLSSQGAIVIVAVITPSNKLRDLARGIVGEQFLGVFVKASLEACQARDPKGLYAKVTDGKIRNFTGKDSGFELPSAPDLVIDTETLSIEEAVMVVFRELQKS